MISFKQFLIEVSTGTLARYIAGRVNQKPVDMRKNRNNKAEKREIHRRVSTGKAWGQLYQRVGKKSADDMVRKARKGIPLEEERLRSPAEILKRAARRYGPKIKGKVKDPEWGELDKSKLIPLHKYDQKLADSAYDKYDDLPHDFPRHSDVSVPIEDLHPGQEYVNVSNDKKLHQKIASKSDRILVMKHKNKLVVGDGHHAIYAAWARGEDHVTPTEYVDMDGFNPRKH